MVRHVDLEVLFAVRGITCATNEAVGVRRDRYFERHVSRHQSPLGTLTASHNRHGATDCSLKILARKSDDNTRQPIADRPYVRVDGVVMFPV